MEQLLVDVRDVVVFARAAIGAPGVPRAIGTIWLAERGEAACPRERVDHACFMLTHKWWVVVVMCQMRIEKYGCLTGMSRVLECPYPLGARYPLGAPTPWVLLPLRAPTPWVLLHLTLAASAPGWG